MPTYSDNSLLVHSAPARNAAAVTPNDSTDLPQLSRIWVGGAGNVVFIPANGSSSVTLTGVAAGSILPILAKRVLATGTTATAITALW